MSIKTVIQVLFAIVIALSLVACSPTSISAAPKRLEFQGYKRTSSAKSENVGENQKRLSVTLRDIAVTDIKEAKLIGDSTREVLVTGGDKDKSGNETVTLSWIVQNYEWRPVIPYRFLWGWRSRFGMTITHQDGTNWVLRVRQRDPWTPLLGVTAIVVL